MKEVIAIVRPNCSVKTREKLAEIGVYGFTGRSVNGKGKESVDIQHSESVIGKSKMVPKRMIMTVVEDEDVDRVVKAIIDVNASGNKGDGKIFVNPVLRTYTIRNGECSESLQDIK